MVREKLENLFREIFADETLELTMDSGPDDIPGWDSLSQVLLIEEAERMFDVSLPLETVFEIRTFGDFVRLIESCIA